LNVAESLVVTLFCSFAKKTCEGFFRFQSVRSCVATIRSVGSVEKYEEVMNIYKFPSFCCIYLFAMCVRVNGMTLSWGIQIVSIWLFLSRIEFEAFGTGKNGKSLIR